MAAYIFVSLQHNQILFHTHCIDDNKPAQVQYET
jgi:hypothetical protein